MKYLWAAEAMNDAMRGRPYGTLPIGVTGISIDTRTLQPGDAFFCIKGDRFDGHDFATAAIKAGASVLIINKDKVPALGRLTIPKIIVDDVLQALVNLGIAARLRSRARIIAVTGSVGKTSTKEALRHALSTSGKVHASDRSFNNHWGVPLTLARMPDDTDFGIFEIGMNHSGEIRPLAKLVRPHIGIVTMIAAAHLGSFNNLDEIAEAKSEIFEGMESDGTALINRDDPRFSLLSNLARSKGLGNIRGYGEDPASDIRLMAADLKPDGSDIAVLINGREIYATLGAPGRHFVQNALAVLGAADLAGADLEQVVPMLASLRPETGRGARHILPLGDGTITLIDESYNANPASMQAAMAVLGVTPVGPGGRRIAVLGDMLELGDHSAELHAGLAPFMEQARVDVAFLAGREMQALATTLPEGFAHVHADTAADIQAPLLQSLRAGDVVMIKSSNGIGFAKIVDAMLGQFSSAKTVDYTA